MGITERKKRHQDNIKKAILDASLKIATEESWDSLSTRKLAEKIEYSTTAIYHYFGNKDAILQELQLDGFIGLKLEMIRTLDNFKDPKERLFNLSISYYDFAIKNPQLYKLMFGIGIECKNHISVSDEMIEIIKSEVLSKLTKDNLDSVFMNWWALSHGFVVIALMKKKDDIDLIILEQQFKDSINRFINSLWR